MTSRSYSIFAAALSLIIGTFHLLRLGLSWEVAIGGVLIPPWVSLIAFVLASYLAYEGFRLGKEKK